MKKILFILSILLPAQTSAIGAPEAVGWILEQQNQDGSWGDQIKGVDYQIYITSSVLVALSDFLSDTSKNKSTNLTRVIKALEGGQVWLKAQRPRDTIGLSYYIQALGVDAFSKELISYQNPDGGWGKGLGFRSTPWYTANAVLGLSAEKIIELEAGADYLVASQEEDGSWENTAIATSAGILALARAYSIKPKAVYMYSVRKGEAWLLTRQGSDGGWFDATSTAESIYAMKTMYSYFRLTGERVSADGGRAFLLKDQRVDGSWGTSSSAKIFDDIHTTSRVVSSLSKGLSYPAIEPRLPIWMNLSSMHAMEGDVIAMEVSTSNEGFLDIVKGTITIRMPVALGGNKIAWDIDSLKVGEAASTFINISIPKGAVGKHFVEMESQFSQANELERSYRSKSRDIVIEVHGRPFDLTLIPTQVVNGSRLNFTAILANLEEVELIVEKTSVAINGPWESLSIFENNGVSIGPTGEGTLKLFEALSPRAPGVYRIPLRILVHHPHLGARWFSFDKDLTVRIPDSISAFPLVPSRIYNLIGMTIFIFATALILNLLIGLDVVE